MRTNQTTLFQETNGRRLVPLLLLPLLLCLPDHGVGATFGDFTYTNDGPAAIITMYTGPGGEVTIPSSIPGIGPVTGIWSGAFHVLFSSGYVSSITVPASVTSIGRGALRGLLGNPSIVVDPQNPAYSSLDGVLFDKSQTVLMMCPGGHRGAYRIPNSVTSIEAPAFMYCFSLTSINLPAGLTAIGELAFWNCGLTNVNIPASVSFIGSEAFGACYGLDAIAVDPQNTAYSSLNGVLFDQAQSVLIQYPIHRTGAYTIPEGVTSIGIGAFEGCEGLKGIIIPNSVTSIGIGAFQFCEGLTGITVPNSVTSIGRWAFSACRGLTSASFQGNAPSDFGSSVFELTAAGFTIYYPSAATGWSTPSWNGYRALPYEYPPAGQRPVLNLSRTLGAVTPAFNYLRPGTNYQLQVSVDLNTWSNLGPAFAATNTGQVHAQSFDVRSGEQLFFRLRSAP